MFDQNKTYWIVFAGDKIEKMTIKGKILEENNHLIKVERERDQSIEFIPISKIIRINEEKENTLTL